MHCSVITRKLNNRLDRIRFKPINVFVFHAVSDSFDPEVNKKIDWLSTDYFKQKIKTLQDRYTFISLEEAHTKLEKDLVRSKKYAVLTCDDGFESILDILPFIIEQNIPITLFLNPLYLDGIHIRNGYAPHPKYITNKQLDGIKSPLVTIGMHGFEHLDATRQTKEEFESSVTKCVAQLSKYPNYIPYFAYTWGRFNSDTQQILKKEMITPVLCDGQLNYHYRNGISRMMLE